MTIQRDLIHARRKYTLPGILLSIPPVHPQLYRQ